MQTQTLRLLDTAKNIKVYQLGYSDGSTGQTSREHLYTGEDYAAYVAGYARGFDATEQIFAIAG